MKKSITLLTALLLISCGNEKSKQRFISSAEIGRQTYEIILRDQIIKADKSEKVVNILKTTDSLYKIEIEKTAKKLYK